MANARRTDLRSVMLIGSGPIVIGQACEFDYSGTQGAKALREEGLRVILANSNPATIMTDPELADATYVEPLTVPVLTRIIAAERPDALLPTLGGQTALNLSLALAQQGVLDKYGVQLIGASVEAIEKAEDREKFKAAMARIGLSVPRSGYARSLEEARAIQKQVGFPVILRPSFTLGGMGGGIAYNREEFEEKAAWGLQQSPRHEILVEQSVLGWKEFELEVMRDSRDNVVIICSIENFDPMGVHTGDSITVAPAMTLTDKEYQRMRDAAMRVIREIGVATGGSNIQFAVNPDDGRMVVVEMNPRVSRSSALASKATGFPIAKIAAKLAIGYTLDEIRNDITRETPASFEPTIDYVVVKIPRFAFEKFPGSDPTLTTQMKSVGEAMAIGRTFREALGKAVRSLETGHHALWSSMVEEVPLEELKRQVMVPTPDRLYQLAAAMRKGLTVEEGYQLTKIDRWFLTQLAIVVGEGGPAGLTASGAEAVEALPAEAWRALKREGNSDRWLAQTMSVDEDTVRKARQQKGVRPVYKRVDTCAAEFEAHTPYLYSTYEEEDEGEPSTRRKVIVLGGGPNRIGQGIEFDYCCVHAVLALRDDGYETVMVNCNPETVSTDYDTSDRLYFEPLTLEDVLAIVDEENKAGTLHGVIVQFGGQTPLKLALGLQAAGVPILGTSADAIDRAEDRERFGAVLAKCGLLAPHWGIARTIEEVVPVAEGLGYPVVVRPSYVLGGRAMEVVHDRAGLEAWVGRVLAAGPELRERSILVDQFLSEAWEVDVDAVSDGHQVLVAGVMEHIEEAGIHSGDSACVLPPHSLPPGVIATIKEQTAALARELGVVGLMNIQFAVKHEAGVPPRVYVLEVNPRASRTVPFVSKATGVPWAKVAAKVMAGRTLAELGVREVVPPHFSVKEAVFPFVKFSGVDVMLGPEMRSTGEVMGIADDFPTAFAKAEIAAGTRLPDKGTVFLSVRESDKEAAVPLARQLVELGFRILATHGTARLFAERGIAATAINKVKEGRPHCVDAMINGEVDLVINTTSWDAASVRDSFSLRRTALIRDLPYFTTLQAARAAVAGIAALRAGEIDVCSLQRYHSRLTRT